MSATVPPAAVPFELPPITRIPRGVPTAIRSDNGRPSEPARTTLRFATSTPTIRSVGVPSDEPRPPTT